MVKNIRCPHCGEWFETTGGRLGRKPYNIGVKNVCDALQLYRTVTATAKKLNCSRGHIYGVLKANGLVIKDILKK